VDVFWTQYTSVFYLVSVWFAASGNRAVYIWDGARRLAEREVEAANLRRNELAARETSLRGSTDGPGQLGSVDSVFCIFYYCLQISELSTGTGTCKGVVQFCSSSSSWSIVHKLQWIEDSYLSCICITVDMIYIGDTYPWYMSDIVDWKYIRYFQQMC